MCTNEGWSHYTRIFLIYNFKERKVILAGSYINWGIRVTRWPLMISEELNNYRKRVPLFLHVPKYWAENRSLPLSSLQIRKAVYPSRWAIRRSVACWDWSWTWSGITSRLETRSQRRSFTKSTPSTPSGSPWAPSSNCLTAASACTAREPLRSCSKSESELGPVMFAHMVVCWYDVITFQFITCGLQIHVQCISSTVELTRIWWRTTVTLTLSANWATDA